MAWSSIAIQLAANARTKGAKDKKKRKSRGQKRIEDFYGRSVSVDGVKGVVGGMHVYESGSGLSAKYRLDMEDGDELWMTTREMRKLIGNARTKGAKDKKKRKSRRAMQRASAHDDFYKHKPKHLTDEQWESIGHEGRSDFLRGSSKPATKQELAEMHKKEIRRQYDFTRFREYGG